MKLSIPNFWFKRNAISYTLLPFSWIYRLIVVIRRLLYKFRIFKAARFSVPVIVVGNITVGGSGKTPLVIWLAKFLRAEGFKPGIISRGYSGHSDVYPLIVNKNSNAAIVGDEALVIVCGAQAPLVIAPRRVDAAKLLLDKFDCNVVISDDGLQHYSLARDLEICVVDGDFQLGNGLCLPAGPLREPQKRLKQTAITVINSNTATGLSITLQPVKFINLIDSDKTAGLAVFVGKRVHAVAGIGNPQRFFKSLRAIGCQLIEHAFPDHHCFVAADLQFTDNYPVLMTEKDAVKCHKIATAKCWYLSIETHASEEFIAKLRYYIREFN